MDPIYGIVALLAIGVFFITVGYTPTRTLRLWWLAFKDWLKFSSVFLLMGGLVAAYFLVWIGIPFLICIALMKLIGWL